MITLWSGNRARCARVRGRLVRLVGLTFIALRHPVLGFTFFGVDPDSVRIEVYHA